MRKSSRFPRSVPLFRIQEKSGASTSTEPQDDERDSFTFCLLATDKENMDEYKAIQFNPCTQYEETIIHQLPYRLGCAMTELGGTLSVSIN